MCLNKHVVCMSNKPTLAHSSNLGSFELPGGERQAMGNPPQAFSNTTTSLVHTLPPKTRFLTLSSTMELDEFTSNSQAFISWLKRNGATVSHKIKLADLRNRQAGRGVGTRFQTFDSA